VFIGHCIKLCSQYEGMEVDYSAASASIIAAGRELPLHVHPMIRDIVASVSYLDEDWREDDQAEENRIRWDNICKLINDYAQNRWAPTFWCLMATYLQAREGKIIAGYGIRVNRVLGKAELLTGNDSLRSVVNELMGSLNADQTDEWYLHNLARVLPGELDGLTLGEVAVSEEIKPVTRL